MRDPGLEHRCVSPTEGHELTVDSEFDDSALVDDADAIGPSSSRQPMSDDDGRSTCQDRVQGPLDLGL